MSVVLHLAAFLTVSSAQTGSIEIGTANDAQAIDCAKIEGASVSLRFAAALHYDDVLKAVDRVRECKARELAIEGGNKKVSIALKPHRAIGVLLMQPTKGSSSLVIGAESAPISSFNVWAMERVGKDQAWAYLAPRALDFDDALKPLLEQAPAHAGAVELLETATIDRVRGVTARIARDRFKLPRDPREQEQEKLTGELTNLFGTSSTIKYFPATTAPRWTQMSSKICLNNKTAVLLGVGMADKIRSQDLLKKTAEMRARSELAKLINVTTERKPGSTVTHSAAKLDTTVILDNWQRPIDAKRGIFGGELWSLAMMDAPAELASKAKQPCAHLETIELDAAYVSERVGLNGATASEPGWASDGEDFVATGDKLHVRTAIERSQPVPVNELITSAKAELTSKLVEQLRGLGRRLKSAQRRKEAKTCLAKVDFGDTVTEIETHWAGDQVAEPYLRATQTKTNFGMLTAQTSPLLSAIRERVSKKCPPALFDEMVATIPTKK